MWQHVTGGNTFNGWKQTPGIGGGESLTASPAGRRGMLFSLLSLVVNLKCKHARKCQEKLTAGITDCRSDQQAGVFCQCLTCCKGPFTLSRAEKPAKTQCEWALGRLFGSPVWQVLHDCSKRWMCMDTSWIKSETAEWTGGCRLNLTCSFLLSLCRPTLQECMNSDEGKYSASFRPGKCN